jgi:hypothetical protein
MQQDAPRHRPFITRLRSYISSPRPVVPSSRALLMLETRLPCNDLPQTSNSTRYQTCILQSR